MGTRFHWFPAGVLAMPLAEVLVGMANGSGGAVVIGVAPRTRHVSGVSDLPETIDRVFQAALLVDPMLVLPLPRAVSLAGKTVLVIEVPPGLPQVYALEGRYLGRQGTQTHPLPARQLRRLLIERGVIQFETQVPPGASLSDLDLERIDAYLAKLLYSLDEPREQSLLRRGCLRSDTTSGEVVLRPTYAGLLLFGKYPQQWLPSAVVLAARFPGVDQAEYFLKQDISGTLPDQLRQAEAFIQTNLQREVSMEVLAHTETPDYPLEAVRELLVNAIAHRDYNLQGDSIHVNLYADRLEVQSPGELPGPVTLENLLEARYARNTVIGQVLADMGFVERLGYGLNRVVALTQARGQKPPRFEEVAGTFKVTLFARTPFRRFAGMAARLSELELSPRQILAVEYLQENLRITNREYQQLCPDVSPETLRRDLADLVSRKVLIKVGDKRSTYYILK